MDTYVVKSNNYSLWLLSASSLFFSASYNILLPVLPSYLIHIGGKSYLGLIILLFTIAALLSRPLSGKLSDLRAGKYAIYIGLFVTIFVNILYPWIDFVLGFLILRFIHGFSTGFAPTGYTFFIKNNFFNRGRAISIQTAFYSAGMAFGPMFSSLIHVHLGINYVFLFGALLGVVAILMVIPLKEENKQKIATIKVSKSILDMCIWKQSLIMFWIYLGFGILLISSSIQANKLGFDNKGIFFVFFSISTIFIRLLFKNKIEGLPLNKLLLYATLMLVFASLLFSLWENKTAFVIASLFYGASMGIFIPVLNLWSLNENSGEDGKALSTLYIFMELGIGLGSLLIGKLIIEHQSAFVYIFLVYGIISSILPILLKKDIG
ncbi:MFS transporter [Mariniflexile gromovii]|uniref:MFS transporter n=1 Tax=Mariniflexile gromovii TaxID=362523 RepID=A0ABS4BWS4_9FLAO|nr:MFS transporter [Mariniflexile gromovii]MBP0905045.1 MFS transporter [Mariniflexile gromovii]